jgi:hypothetical protein
MPNPLPTYLPLANPNPRLAAPALQNIPLGGTATTHVCVEMAQQGTPQTLHMALTGPQQLHFTNNSTERATAQQDSQSLLNY